jgi:hypothetical protein
MSAFLRALPGGLLALLCAGVLCALALLAEG